MTGFGDDVFFVGKARDDVKFARGPIVNMACPWGAGATWSPQRYPRPGMSCLRVAQWLGSHVLVDDVVKDLLLDPLRQRYELIVNLEINKLLSMLLRFS